MDNMDFLIKQLQSKKLRKTRLRMLILEAMFNSARPLSVEDMLNFVTKNKFGSHKTSVYRQLDVLQKEKIVREIQFGESKKRYEIYPEKHHHHFVCTNCGHIEDVDSEKDVDNLEKKITQEKKFKIINHSLEFFGLCNKCN